MAKVSELLSLAASQIGYKESPANSNNTKYGIWYGMNYEPWCDMFVSWVGAQVGQNDIGKYAYCPYHVSYFKSKGLWHDRSETPQPGWVIFFANKGTACHVGFVESARSYNDVTTIEGNTSVTSNDNGGAVMRRYRTAGSVGSSWYILGYGAPNYDPERTRDRSVQIWDYDPNNVNQQFFIRDFGNGEYAIRSAACWEWLSDPGSSTTATILQTWGGENGPDGNRDPRPPQILTFEKIDQYGTVKIHPKVAPNLSMDVSGGSNVNGTKLGWYPSNDTLAQRFHILQIDDTVRIVNVGSGKALDIPNGGWK